jgi:hypothetical protein
MIIVDGFRIASRVFLGDFTFVPFWCISTKMPHDISLLFVSIHVPIYLQNKEVADNNLTPSLLRISA